MPDRKEVISHLQIMNTWADFAMEKDINYFTNYHFMKIVKWTEEALELLKEQKSVKPDYMPATLEWSCGNCGFTFDRCKFKYCPNCGRRVKWDA